MATSITPDAGSTVDYTRLRRNTIIATPFTLLVPVLLAVVLDMAGADLEPAVIGFGALGWILALALRAPISVIALRLLGDQERVKPWIVGSSGPLEEGVRLIALLIVGRSFSDAASLGLGWAAIEVVYSLITGIVTLSLVRRTDEQAIQARQMLEAQGMLRETGPALGVIERIGASTLHIGFTLLLAWRLVLLPVTIVLHTATNFTALRLFQRSPLVTEMLLLAAGLAAFVIGIAVMR